MATEKVFNIEELLDSEELADYKKTDKKREEKAEEIKLTKKQQKAYDLMCAGKNVFITGPPGTGKSLAIKLFKEKSTNKRIAITSTTGISALLIGGTTLHSYLGIALGKGTAEQLVDLVLSKAYICQRWKKLQILVIDEISMLSPDLFDKLEYVANVVRENLNPLQKPFGGIQLILSGDFLQLPVVGSDNFCFEAKTWKKCVEETVYLTEIMRQSDTTFQRILGNIRYGIVEKRDKKILDSRIGIELKNDLGIIPTIIHTTNEEVDKINKRELSKLTGELYEYELAIFSDPSKRFLHDKYKKSCIAPEILHLCVGAQVMLLCNLDLEAGLANGSRGVVVDFCEDMPIVKFLDGTTRVIDHHTWKIEEGGKIIMEIVQIPLKLAYAITTHKSQGCTLDYAIINLANIFTHAMAYVALSRVKNLDGMSIQAIDYASIKAHPKAVEYYKNL